MMPTAARWLDVLGRADELSDDELRFMVRLAAITFSVTEGRVDADEIPGMMLAWAEAHLQSREPKRPAVPPIPVVPPKPMLVRKPR